MTTILLCCCILLQGGDSLKKKAGRCTCEYYQQLAEMEHRYGNQMKEMDTSAMEKPFILKRRAMQFSSRKKKRRFAGRHRNKNERISKCYRW